MNNNFDKYTLGNSPAAIYIIDLLNNTERKKAIYLIKAYSEFKQRQRAYTISQSSKSNK